MYEHDPKSGEGSKAIKRFDDRPGTINYEWNRWSRCLRGGD